MWEQTHIGLQNGDGLRGREEELVPKVGSAGGNIGERCGCQRWRCVRYTHSVSMCVNKPEERKQIHRQDKREDPVRVPEGHAAGGEGAPVVAN